MGRLTKEFKYGWGHKDCYDDCASCDPEGFCDFLEEMLNKLAHYEDLEEQGRLIELPCSVGDAVWWISSKKVKRGRIVEIDWNNAAFAFFVESDYFVRFTLQEDEVYFTKEEAEAKLKEMEGDHIADVRNMGKE